MKLTKQELPPIVLKKLLQGYSIGTVKKIKPLATSGNISYIINTNKKSYFLRLSPLGLRWRSKSEIDAELELINYLFENRFPVVKPVFTKTGKQIISWKNHYGYLREFVDAKHKLNPSLVDIKEFGKVLGIFHNLVHNYRTKYKRKHIWDLEETKKNFHEDKKMILRSNFGQKMELIKKFEKEIFSLNLPDRLPSGTIHEDLGKRHILWRDGKIVSIIDFDRSYYGKLLFDLGQACRGWCFSNDWKKWSNRKFQHLLDGYQSNRRLTDLEKKYLVDAIKFGILERSLSFSLRFIEITNDPEDEEYALFSISENGPLGMIERNREKIEEFLKK
jgi:Ser/Thr protein kinase RdoA (MazF antagonist)